MSKKNVFRSIFAFVVMFVMFSVTTIVSEAAAPTELRQTEGGEGHIKIVWTPEATSIKTYGWYIKWSVDGKNFYRIDDDDYPDESYNAAFSKSGLNAGASYWIQVASVYKNAQGDYYAGTYSTPLHVVTAPAEPTQLIQTAAAPGKVTISWNACAGATGYYVYKDSTRTTPVATVTGLSATISAVTGDDIDDVYVKPFKKSNAGYIATDDYKSMWWVKCVPNKPGKVASNAAGNIKWKTLKGDNEVTVGWNRSTNDKINADGWHVQVFSLNDKLLKNYYVDDSYSYSKTFSLSKIKNKGFKVRVRGYIYIDNKRFYGNWSSKTTIVPAAGITVRNTSKKTAKKISWKKIANATKYEVYVNKDVSVFGGTDIASFRKVATLKPSQTSYVYKSFKKGSDNGVFVKATVKVGKKKVKSTVTEYTYFYVYN